MTLLHLSRPKCAKAQNALRAVGCASRTCCGLGPQRGPDPNEVSPCRAGLSPSVPLRCAAPDRPATQRSNENQISFAGQFSASALGLARAFSCDPPSALFPSALTVAALGTRVGACWGAASPSPGRHQVVADGGVSIRIRRAPRPAPPPRWQAIQGGPPRPAPSHAARRRAVARDNRGRKSAYWQGYQFSVIGTALRGLAAAWPGTLLAEMSTSGQKPLESLSFPFGHCRTATIIFVKEKKKENIHLFSQVHQTENFCKN